MCLTSFVSVVAFSYTILRSINSFKRPSFSPHPQPVQTSAMWAWWGTTSCLKVSMCLITTGMLWDPPKLLQDMWVGVKMFAYTWLSWQHVAYVMVADKEKWDRRISSSAPVTHLPIWCLGKLNPSHCHIWNDACAHCSHLFSPGNHGDRLHTCDPPDADLCPAPHHHVLPREVNAHFYMIV